MKDQIQIPETIENWINGKEAAAGAVFEKRSPHDGSLLFLVARSGPDDVEKAVEAAVPAQKKWAAVPAVERGHLLHQACNLMEKNQSLIARVVADETGKSFSEAFGETGGAIALGRFYAGEGQRLYGRTTTSGAENKHAMTVRQPIGVAGLIIAANTPIANAAWKVFPALICGNSAVLKAAEDTPATAWIFSKILHDAGIPDGVLNVIQGYGPEAGSPLVEDKRVSVISFTGSTAVGREIAEKGARRLARVSLELGGKNPLVVCDDADLDNAVKWVCLSAFSNAGQRCAACSRVIVFESVYDAFRDRLAEAAGKLKVGPEDSDDLGPVINEKQLGNMLGAIEKARSGGAKVLCGGRRLTGEAYQNGCYMAPTVMENVDPDDPVSREELFGPITILYRVDNFDQALAMANDSPYGLTACIHTRNYHRAMVFSHQVEAGVAVVNAGTYGSEPHMPFGGLKDSGNGTREPGTEALDVYSELKDIYMVVDPAKI